MVVALETRISIVNRAERLKKKQGRLTCSRTENFGKAGLGQRNFMKCIGGPEKGNIFEPSRIGMLAY